MKLVCQDCQRENEVERIYCHDCGARLNRAALAKQEKLKEEDAKDTQRRLKSMINPPGAKLRHQLLQGTKLILSAILAAGLVQMFRSPDLPAAPKDADELPPQINLELEDATMSPPGGRSLNYTEEQVNAYLGYKLKAKQKALSGYLKFERTAATLEEAFAHVTVGRSLAGYPVFTTVKFAPRLEKGNLTARIISGNIGRLPVHPEIMKLSGFLFSDVAAVFDRDRKAIAKLGGLEIHPKMVTVLPKQAPL